MICWKCAVEAMGFCKFCGRAVCKKDSKTMPYILAAYSGSNGVLKAIVVGDSLYCGVCKPQPEPVEIAEFT